MQCWGCVSNAKTVESPSRLETQTKNSQSSLGLGGLQTRSEIFFKRDKSLDPVGNQTTIARASESYSSLSTV